MEWDNKLKDFFVSNEETKLAVCNLCNKSVSFKSTTINLIQHMALAHSEELLSSFPVVISNEEELPDNGSIPVVISCDSWSFFETVEGSTTATCTLCLKKISFKTSRSNLEQHLKIEHADIYKNFISSKSAPALQNGAEGENYEKKVENSLKQKNCLDTDNGSSENVISELVINSGAKFVLPSDEDYIIISSKRDRTKRKHTSPVWKIFDMIPNTEMATCSLCQKIISYKSTTANLKTHIERIHPVAYNIHFVSSKSGNSQNGSKENNSDADNNPEDEHSTENNMLNSSMTIRSNRSKLWNFFDKIPNTFIAKCTLCQKVISYKSTRANLKSHLKRIHPVAYKKQFISSKSATPQNDPDEESDLGDNNSDEESPLKNNSEDEHLLEGSILNSSKTIRSNRSKLWDFFDKIPNTQMAMCTLCQKKLSYKSATFSNLKRHMKGIHPVTYNLHFVSSKSITPQNSSEENNSDAENSHVDNNSEDEQNEKDNMFDSSKTMRKNRSDVWNFFDKITNTDMAVCAICQNKISYKHTASNLRRHLKRIHPMFYHTKFTLSQSATVQNDSEEESGLEKIHLDEKNSHEENSHVENNSEDEHLLENNMLNSSKITRRYKSRLWKFFDKIPNTEMATCTFCQKQLSYRSSVSNLRHHMERIHPMFYHTQFILPQSATVQNDSEEESGVEKIYLDEENSHEKNSQVENYEEEHLLEDNMLNSSKITRRNRSLVWNFFDRIPNTETAMCTFCQKIISYRSTTAHLMSHIRRIHPSVYHKNVISSKTTSPQNHPEENISDEDNFQVENNSEDEHLLEDNMLNSSKITRNRSRLWKFFDKIPNTEMATCTFCQKQLSYRSSVSNLRHHMERIHPMFYHTQFILPQSATVQNDSEEESGVEKINLEEENSHKKNSHVENNSEEHLLEDNMLNSSKITRSYRNLVWNFFDRIPNTETAMCTLCQKIISYRSTTAHLTSHLRRIHPSVYHKNVILSKSTSPQNHTEENFSDEDNFQVENNSEDEYLLEDNLLKSSKITTRNRSDVWNTNLTLSKTESASQCESPLLNLEVIETNRFDIWKVFDRIQNTKMATCTLCQRNMSYKSTTASLRNHIKRIHPETYFQRSKERNGQEGATSENENFNVGNNSEHKTSMLDSLGSYKSDIKMDITSEENLQQPVKNCSEKLRQDNFGHFSKYCNRAILNFFERNGKTKIFRCKLCHNTFSYRSTIMHLRQHLKNKHKREYADINSRSASPSKNIYEVYIAAGEDQEQEDSKDKLSSIFNFDNLNHIRRDSGENKHTDTQMDPFDSDENIIEEPPKKIQRISSINWACKIQPDEKKNIDRCLLKLITEDFQPFSIVEDKGFQEFIAVLNPNYQLPSQKTLSSLLAEEYTRKLAEFKEITHSCSSISLSVDCWSSRNMQSFMTVTAHFINQNTFEFCSVLIKSAGLHVEDTAEQIATQLHQVTSEWDVINKVKFIAFDNAPKMVSAARILNWPYFICFANKFNSIVQGALNNKPIAVIVEKVRKAVVYFKRNSVAKEMLHDYQVKTQQVAQPKGLVLGIPICWITVCKMLKRFNELQEAVRATFSHIDQEIPAITSDEWQCIDQLVEILKPFEEAATIMSSEKYLIAGKAVVLTAGLYKVCIDLTERNFCEPISDLILKLKNDISTIFGDIEKNEAISVCTLLDPRFKQHAFEDYTAMLNAKKCVLQKLKQLNNEQSVDSAGSSSTKNSNTDSSLLGRFYSKVASSYQPEMTQHKTMDELNRYLSENVIPPTECSLRWWKERRMLYPGLSKIFVECSNIVVTSLPCDRAFTKTGYILSDRLNGLTTSKVDKIMFLNVNN